MGRGSAQQGAGVLYGNPAKRVHAAANARQEREQVKTELDEALRVDADMIGDICDPNGDVDQQLRYINEIKTSGRKFLVHSGTELRAYWCPGKKKADLEPLLSEDLEVEPWQILTACWTDPGHACSDELLEYTPARLRWKIDDEDHWLEVWLSDAELIPQVYGQLDD